MDDLIPRSLAPGPRRALNAGLNADRALADELEMIASALEAACRERFWVELAAACEEIAASGEPGSSARPAAAVLAALERAARGPARGSPGPPATPGEH